MEDGGGQMLMDDFEWLWSVVARQQIVLTVQLNYVFAEVETGV